VVNLIVASDNKDKMTHWIELLGPIYSLVFFDNIESIFAESVKYDENAILVLDSALLIETGNFSLIYQYIKKIIVVGHDFTPKQQVQLIYEGASGYADYSINKNLIIRAIEGITKNEIWLERQLIPQVLKRISARQGISDRTGKFNNEVLKTISILTQREIEVIELVYNGEDNIAISKHLHITTRTVKAHLSAIFRKLKVQDRFQLVVLLKDLHVGRLSINTPVNN
jgi:DNA-binding NarL/FixJ family response regulator